MSIINERNLVKFIPVIETYINGTSWYRIYADDWCEQGGRFVSQDAQNITVNFLKEYKDTNFSIIVGKMIGSSGNPSYWTYAVYRFDTKSMVICNATNGSNNNCQWEVRGYLAEGQY